jgi:hypothetical protein
MLLVKKGLVLFPNLDFREGSSVRASYGFSENKITLLSICLSVFGFVDGNMLVLFFSSILLMYIEIFIRNIRKNSMEVISI